VVLAGGRVDLGDLLDVLDEIVGDAVGAAELALDLDEDGLHGAPIIGATSAPRKPQPPRAAAGTSRRMKAGTWSPKGVSPTASASSSASPWARPRGAASLR